MIDALIDAQIIGNLPHVSDNLAPAMERIADRMYQDALGEFDSSGYGKWPATREGKPSMLGGRAGMIASSLRKESSATRATVYAMNTIHQRGGSMIITEKQHRFFWAMWYATGENRWKNMALNRTGVMSFPVRTYLTLLPSLIEYAKQELKSEIFTARESVEKTTIK